MIQSWEDQTHPICGDTLVFAKSASASLLLLLEGRGDGGDGGDGFMSGKLIIHTVIIHTESYFGAGESLLN